MRSLWFDHTICVSSTCVIVDVVMEFNRLNVFFFLILFEPIESKMKNDQVITLVKCLAWNWTKMTPMKYFSNKFSDYSVFITYLQLKKAASGNTKAENPFEQFDTCEECWFILFLFFQTRFRCVHNIACHKVPAKLLAFNNNVAAF